jgi:phosphatidylglycerophosphate synthase
VLDLMRDRGAVARLLDGVGTFASRAFLSPRGWTLLGGAIGILGGVAIGLRWYGAAIGAFAFAAFCDMADGAVARRRGAASPAGCVLDVTVDKYVEGAAAIGTAVGAPPFLGLSAALWAALAIWGSILIAVIWNAGLVASGGRKPAHWTYKLFGRAERGLVLGLGMALAWATGDEIWLTAVVLAFGAAASHATALGLVWGFVRLLEPPARGCGAGAPPPPLAGPATEPVRRPSG